MEWLTSNAGTIIAGILLAVLVFFLVRSTLKNRKHGCGCSGGGCGGCRGCSGFRSFGTMAEKGEGK